MTFGAVVASTPASSPVFRVYFVSEDGDKHAPFSIRPVKMVFYSFAECMRIVVDKGGEVGCSCLEANAGIKTGCGVWVVDAEKVSWGRSRKVFHDLGVLNHLRRLLEIWVFLKDLFLSMVVLRARLVLVAKQK